MTGQLGICVIGRNEARRLEASLSAIRSCGRHRVYVDSDSTDESVDIARRFAGDIDVVRITERGLCTAARGRNIGFEHLWRRSPRPKFVQFVDGDCVLADGWLEAGLATLRARPDVAVVAGRLREEERTRNVYHRLAEMEWNEGGTGEVATVGGIFMVRADVYRAVGGMHPWMAQGEEPELARRIRSRGHRVVRLDMEMGRHDIGIDRFAQWWSRAAREGRATAHSVRINGASDREALRHMISMAFWGATIPAAATALALPTLGLSSGLLAGYAVLWRRVYRDRLRQGDSPEDAGLYAAATVLGKVANAGGLAGYTFDVLRRRVRRLART